MSLRSRIALVAGVAIACKEGLTNPNTTHNVSMSDYHGLEEDASWVYTDHLDTGGGLPDESELIRAKHTGDGTVVFRKGTRWVDGDDAGRIVFDSSYGLTMTSWDLGDASGAAELKLASEFVSTGGSVSLDGWTCTANIDENADTFYGEFEDTIKLSCEGRENLTGEWVFAKNIGLIKIDAVGANLQLVAPF